VIGTSAAAWWCAGRDLNPHGISTTSPSNSRVCRSTTRALMAALTRGADSWPRSRATSVTTSITNITALAARPAAPRLAYGPGFGASGLAWLAGAAGAAGADIGTGPLGAGPAGANGTIGVAGTTLRLTVPDPKILPVKRRVEA
jgi:hypothetical protein